MTLGQFQQIVPQNEMQTFEESRRQDTLCPLFQLGYLSSLRPTNPQLEKAIAQFRLDGVKEKLLSISGEQTDRQVLDSIELELLHKLVAFEGDIRLTNIPKKGDCNLSSRMMHYRLIQLGLYQGKSVDPINKSTVTALKQLNQFIPLELGLVNLVNLSGDLVRLLKLVAKNPILTERVVVFNYRPDQRAKIITATLMENNEEEETLHNQRKEQRLNHQLEELSQAILPAAKARNLQFTAPLHDQQNRASRIRLLIETIIEELKQSQKVNLPEIVELKAAINQETDRRTKKRLERKLKKKIDEHEQQKTQRELKIQHLVRRLNRINKRNSNLKFSYKARLKKSLHPRAFKNIKKNIFINRDRSFLTNLHKHPVNHFLIRLIQLYQWTNGYYFGRLDSDFGKRTFESIVQLAKDTKGLKLKYVLMQLQTPNKGIWVLNIQYLLNKMLRRLHRSKQVPDSSKLIQTYASALLDKQGNRAVLADQVFTDYQQEIATQLSQPASKARFIYYGIKSIAKTASKIVKKLLWFIKNGIKKILTAFKNTIRLIYKFIREGIKQYGLGIALIVLHNYLPNLKTNTVTQLLQKFNITSLFLKNNSSHHPEENPRLHFAVLLTAKVIKWGLALGTGTLTWPRLALKAAQLFKNLFNHWVRGKPLTGVFQLN